MQVPLQIVEIHNLAMKIIIPTSIPLFVLLILCGATTTVTTAGNDSLYHYSICFPADATALCPDDPEIPGVSFEEYGCDLLAISSNDQFLPATSDSSCYKIFRTYRIINWCEYDGEASPTVVSRDWDGWNGTNPGRCGRPLPDGNDAPGDRGICVVVKRDLTDLLPDTVWYDADNNPYNSMPDNPATGVTEGYWWRVISGGNDPGLESYYEGNCSTWAFDDNQTDSDIRGNIAADDNDRRYGSFGFWEYTQHIAVYNDTPPEVTIAGMDTFCTVNGLCETEIEATVRISSVCTSNEDLSLEAFLYTGDDDHGQNITEDLTGALPDLQYTATLPLGTYRIEVIADDGCGNQTREDKTFTVVDCIPPAPICIDRLSVGLMPETETGGASMAVWASDFIASPIYDCSGQNETQTDDLGRPLVTQYSINRVGDSVLIDQQGITVTCADTLEPQLLEVHAWDTEGNHDYCQVELVVQDNGGHCPAGEPVFALAGQIITESGKAIPDVEVYVKMAPDQEERMIQQTGTDGQFVFRTTELPLSATIRAEKVDDAFAGLGLRDALLLIRHILGRNRLQSPYQLLAADLNRSGTITVLDLIYLRKALLGMYEEWPAGHGWMFLDARFRFANPEHPWDEYYPEAIPLATLHATDTIRFTGIKMGDVDRSALGPQVSSTVLRSATAAVPLTYTDRLLRKGEQTEVELSLSQAKSIAGGRFSIVWDPQRATITPLAAPESATSVRRLPEGEYRSLFLPEEGRPGELLTWRFVIQPREDIWLSELWRLGRGPVPAEVIRENDAMMAPLALQAQTSTDHLQVQLLTNPVIDAVRIQCRLPQTGTVVVRIHTGAGQTIWSREFSEVAAGEHQWTVQEDVTSWPSGTYWLQLVLNDRQQRQIPFVVQRK